MLILNVSGIIFFAVKVKPLYIEKGMSIRVDHSIVEARVGQKYQKSRARELSGSERKRK